MLVSPKTDEKISQYTKKNKLALEGRENNEKTQR